jgi:hypothetical protein
LPVPRRWLPDQTRSNKAPGLPGRIERFVPKWLEPGHQNDFFIRRFGAGDGQQSAKADSAQNQTFLTERSKHDLSPRIFHPIAHTHRAIRVVGKNIGSLPGDEARRHDLQGFGCHCRTQIGVRAFRRTQIGLAGSRFKKDADGVSDFIDLVLTPIATSWKRPDNRKKTNVKRIRKFLFLIISSKIVFDCFILFWNHRSKTTPDRRNLAYLSLFEGGTSSLMLFFTA